MGKPTASEESIRTIPVGMPTVQNNVPVGTSPSDVLADPSRFCSAIFKVGSAKIKIDLNTKPDVVARRMCHRNGFTLPRAKGAKSLLQEVVTKMIKDGHLLIRSTPATDILSRLEKSARRKVNKANAERRQAAEREMRSAMKKWDFSLEEVTQMWQDRLVDSVHEH